MKWRSKSNDLQLVDSFLHDLTTFKKFKKDRWESIEESVQMSNLVGTPTEDWIIPPDREKVREVLEQDRDYISLKDAIVEKTPIVKEIADFLKFDTHHKFDWITFVDPLIGISALDDAIKSANDLKESLVKTHYFFKNLNLL